MRSRERTVSAKKHPDTQKDPVSQSRRSFLGKVPAMPILVAATVAGTLVPNVIGEKDVPRLVPRAKDAPKTKKTLEKPLDKKAMDAFFAIRMKPVIDKLNEREYATISEINRLFSERREDIHKHFKKYPIIVQIYEHAPPSREIMAGSRVENDQPLAFHITPAYMDFYQRAKDEKVQNIDALLESTLVINTMHELDHLALKHVRTPFHSNEWVDQSEAEAWAKTCEDTIRLFAEKELPIYGPYMRYYQTWVKSGRAINANWTNYIRSQYALLR